MRRQINSIASKAARRIAPTTPPTTPPAIAPVFVCEPLSRFEEDGDAEGDEDGSVDIAAPVSVSTELPDVSLDERRVELDVDERELDDERVDDEVDVGDEDVELLDVVVVELLDVVVVIVSVRLVPVAGSDKTRTSQSADSAELRGNGARRGVCRARRAHRAQRAVARRGRVVVLIVAGRHGGEKDRDRVAVGIRGFHWFVVTETQLPLAVSKDTSPTNRCRGRPSSRGRHCFTHNQDDARRLS